MFDIEGIYICTYMHTYRYIYIYIHISNYYHYYMFGIEGPLTKPLPALTRPLLTPSLHYYYMFGIEGIYIHTYSIHTFGIDGQMALPLSVALFLFTTAFTYLYHCVSSLRLYPATTTTICSGKGEISNAIFT